MNKRKAEPYRIKMVEYINQIPFDERKKKIVEAGYNVFALKAEDIYIDLLTDSGTSAMSDKQWAGLMTGDESYAGSKSFYKLQDSVKKIFGYQYTVPTHQGRGAENVLFPLLIKPGQYVLGNMHFDTTTAHIELKGGKPVELIVKEAFDTASYHPFKGNFDLVKVKSFIEDKGPENCAFILITITCNSAGGQPVSMDNIREIKKIGDKYGLRVFFDAARFAENAYFIKQREEDYKDKSIEEIVREMFSYADGFTMSSKKDGLVNIGGMIGIKEDEALSTKVKSMLVPIEGFPTYGGQAGRDMEALSIGLQEVVDERYLEARVSQIEYLGKRLLDAGIPIQYPVGGHAVFVDAKKLLPHIPYHMFPGQSLVVELYLESGIRAVEIGSFLHGNDPTTGKQIESSLELVRLTIPRRVYTDNHMDVVADALISINERRESLKGLKVIYEPEVLRHFTAKLEPVE